MIRKILYIRFIVLLFSVTQLQSSDVEQQVRVWQKLLQETSWKDLVKDIKPIETDHGLSYALSSHLTQDDVTSEIFDMQKVNYTVPYHTHKGIEVRYLILEGSGNIVTQTDDNDFDKEISFKKGDMFIIPSLAHYYVVPDKDCVIGSLTMNHNKLERDNDVDDDTEDVKLPVFNHELFNRLIRVKPYTLGFYKSYYEGDWGSRPSKDMGFRVAQAIIEDDFQAAKSLLIQAKDTYEGLKGHVNVPRMNFEYPYVDRKRDRGFIWLVELALEYKRYDIVRLLIHHGAIVTQDVYQQFYDKIADDLREIFHTSYSKNYFVATRKHDYNFIHVDTANYEIECMNASQREGALVYDIRTKYKISEKVSTFKEAGVALVLDRCKNRYHLVALDIDNKKLEEAVKDSLKWEHQRVCCNQDEDCLDKFITLHFDDRLKEEHMVNVIRFFNSSLALDPRTEVEIIETYDFNSHILPIPDRDIEEKQKLITRAVRCMVGAKEHYELKRSDDEILQK